MHKSELAALDRKITAELAPTYEVPDDRMGVKHDENDGKCAAFSRSTSRNLTIRNRQIRLQCLVCHQYYMAYKSGMCIIFTTFLTDSIVQLSYMRIF